MILRIRKGQPVGSDRRPKKEPLVDHINVQKPRYWVYVPASITGVTISVLAKLSQTARYVRVHNLDIKPGREWTRHLDNDFFANYGADIAFPFAMYCWANFMNRETYNRRYYTAVGCFSIFSMIEVVGSHYSLNIFDVKDFFAYAAGLSLGLLFDRLVFRNSTIAEVK